MRSTHRTFLKALGWLMLLFVAASAAGVVVSNARLPHGDHVVIATGLLEPEFPHNSMISGLYLKAVKWEGCNIVGTVSGKVVSEKDGRLPFLLAVLERSVNDEWQGRVDKGLLERLTISAIDECNPNSFNPNVSPIPPLVYAIMLRDSKLVRLLLLRGADPELKINRPGKTVDGMNAIEFAELLRTAEKNIRERSDLEEIVRLLRSVMDRELLAPAEVEIGTTVPTPARTQFD